MKGQVSTLLHLLVLLVLSVCVTTTTSPFPI